MVGMRVCMTQILVDVCLQYRLETMVLVEQKRCRGLHGDKSRGKTPNRDTEQAIVSRMSREYIRKHALK